jgi:hypothetical protein
MVSFLLYSVPPVRKARLSDADALDTFLQELLALCQAVFYHPTNLAIETNASIVTNKACNQ